MNPPSFPQHCETSNVVGDCVWTTSRGVILWLSFRMYKPEQQYVSGLVKLFQVNQHIYIIVICSICLISGCSTKFTGCVGRSMRQHRLYYRCWIRIAWGTSVRNNVNARKTLHEGFYQTFRNKLKFSNNILTNFSPD